jgi:hemerythrin superfamily protein
MVLTRQHNQVRALLEQLQALPSHKTGGSAEDLSARKSIVDMITIRLSQHETTEEKHLWPAVRKALEEGDALADEAISQEQAGTQTLAELGNLAPDTDRFDECVEQLVAQCRKHVAYEEKVFALLRDALPEDQRERMGRKIEAATAKGPTRPHKRPATTMAQEA